MSNLEKLQDKVEYCLEKFERCRDDDRLLIGAVYYKFYGVDPRTVYFVDVIKRDDLASFESIRRCRQKAQERRPELRGSREARKRRKEQEQRVRAYVKEE